jgi:hypothetical protein
MISLDTLPKTSSNITDKTSIEENDFVLLWTWKSQETSNLYNFQRYPNSETLVNTFGKANHLVIVGCFCFTNIRGTTWTCGNAQSAPKPEATTGLSLYS